MIRKISLIIMCIAIFVSGLVTISILKDPKLEKVEPNGDAKILINIGETEKIQNYTIIPSSAKVYSITFSSSNERVATVDKNGNVYGVQEGICIVTITINNEVSLDYSVRVFAIDVNDIELSVQYTTLAVGQTSDFTATVSPFNATYKELTYSSSNPEVAIVNAENKIEALGVGTTTITATAVSGETEEVTITVQEKLYPSNVIISGGTSVKRNKSIKLTCTFEPGNVTEKDIVWKSYDTNIATVDQEGNVFGVKEGRVKIEAKCLNEVYAFYYVDVIEIPATFVTIDNNLIEDFANMSNGDTVQIEYTLMPFNTTDTSADVTFSVRDAGYLTVSETGLITVISSETFSTYVFIKVDGEVLGSIQVTGNMS